MKTYSITPELCEFVGILIGDGWLGRYTYKNKVKRWIGISGHKVDDKHYLTQHIRNLAIKIFGRSGHYKEKANINAGYLILQDVNFFDFLSQQMEFPIGIKKEIKICKKLQSLEWNLFRLIIRGLFDTDGSLYFEKNYSNRYHYPTIEISNHSDALLEQVSLALKQQDYSIIRGPRRIRLKGKKTLIKWMNDIGSSNLKHISKYKLWKKHHICLPNKILPFTKRMQLLKPS